MATIVRGSFSMPAQVLHGAGDFLSRCRVQAPRFLTRLANLKLVGRNACVGQSGHAEAADCAAKRIRQFCRRAARSSSLFLSARPPETTIPRFGDVGPRNFFFFFSISGRYTGKREREFCSIYFYAFHRKVCRFIGFRRRVCGGRATVTTCGEPMRAQRGSDCPRQIGDNQLQTCIRKARDGRRRSAMATPQQRGSTRAAHLWKMSTRRR